MALALFGLAASVAMVVPAVPASAVPPPSAPLAAPVVGKVVGVGSATADPVLSGLSRSTTINGQSVLGSFDVSGSGSISTKDTGGCSIVRPVNDEQGIGALLTSARAGDGCVDFARAVTPYAPGGVPATTDPGLVYVPFARDGLTFAVNGASNVPGTITTEQLRAIYHCDPAMGGIRALLPGAGSGQRTLWLGMMRLADADVRRGAYPCVVDRDAGGRPLGENDGRGLDANSVMPFSIASYLAQTGATQADVTAGVHLGVLSDLGQLPVVPNAARYPGGVSFAVSTSSNIGSRMSLADLQSVYTCTVTGVTPLLPSSGDTRSAWEALLGISDDDVVAGRYPCIRPTAAANDGRGLGNDAIMPFAVGGYANQLLGIVADVRGAARLGTIDNSGTASTPPLPLLLNPAYGGGFDYHVYNAMPFATVNTSPANEVFIGPNSLVCQQPLVIAAFGFAPLDGDAEPCGSLQHDSTAPVAAAPLVRAASAAATHVDVRPTIALDHGYIPGSGTHVHARHGACALDGTFTNSFTEILSSAWVIGPHCTVTLTAWYYHYADGSTNFPSGDFHTKTISNLGALIVSHGPGFHYLAHNGVSNGAGDTLVSVDFSINDDTLGGAYGAMVTLHGQDVPGVDGLTATNRDHGVTLLWRQREGAVSYRVECFIGVGSWHYGDRCTLGGGNWVLMDTVADPSGGEVTGKNVIWRYEGVPDGQIYFFRVTPVFANGSTGNASNLIKSVPEEPYRAKHYVAMGDSYSSGTGATGYDGNQCRRSAKAYAGQLKDQLDTQDLGSYARANQGQVDIVACNGAVANNIIPGLPGSGVQGGMESWNPYAVFRNQQRAIAPDYQINMLWALRDRPVDLITLSIGGNDAGFSDVILQCALGFGGCTGGASLATYEAKLKATIDGLAPRLRSVYDAVAETGGDARVLVIGYPHIFADNGSNNCAIDNPLSWATSLGSAKMAMLNRMTDELDTVIANTVSAANEAPRPGRIDYIDTRALFQGHDTCAGGNAWINKIRWAAPFVDTASAHPNNAGWAAEAALISATYFGTGS
ncbi:hypothetical protein Lfu02_02020 [Longispora fulva]|nr:hypothetical protein Lfu02_02020 [Longispora fulva]